MERAFAPIGVARRQNRPGEEDPVGGASPRKETAMRLYHRVVLAAMAIVLLMMVPAVGLAASPKTVKPAGCTAGVAVSHFAVFNTSTGQHRLEFSLDKAYIGSEWKLVLRHNDSRFLREVRTATKTGEINVRTWASDRTGADTFSAKALNLRNGQLCRAVIVH